MPKLQFPTVFSLAGNPAIESSFIGPLQQLSVLCGPNSSGKSTVLRAIQSGATSAFGIYSEDLPIDEVAVKYNEQAQQMNLPATMGGLALRIFQEHVSRETVIRFDQIESLARRVYQDHQTRNVGASPSPLHLRSALVDVFPEPPTSILVPPSRSPSDRELGVPSAMNSTGQFVVGHLFHLQNQRRSSPEYAVFQLVAEAFRFVTAGHSFLLESTPNNKIRLSFEHPHGTIVEAEDAGLGLQDVLVLIFMAHAPGYSLVLIEEPESHLHPAFQRRLLSHLRTCGDRQFILSTHSNVFLSGGHEAVFLARCPERISVSNATSRSEALSDLGYDVADNLVADLVVLVEGPSDVPVLREFLDQMGLMARHNIRFWPLGGDIMAQLDLSVFTDSYKVIALLDSDPRSGHVREKFVKMCSDIRVRAHRLERYALENYFSIPALKAVFKGQFPLDVTELDPKMKVEDQIGIDPKRNNRRIATAMRLSDIAGTDLEVFLQSVKSMLEPAASVEA